MKRWLWALGVVLIVALVIWTLRTPTTASSAADANVELGSAPSPEPFGPSGTKSSERDATPATHGRRVSKAEHAELRRRIAESLEARASTPAPKSAAPRETPETRGPSKSDLRDRTDGALTKFMGTLNEDFMPLADECFDDAREADPNLQGLLDLEFSIMADEELGGLVDAVALGAENEIEDPGLTECIRETMLSTVFPAPGGNGQTEVRLTIPLEREAP